MNRLICFALFAAVSATSFAQSWTRTATNGPASAGVPLLLTDGTVMVHNISTEAWWRLTPNSFGDYIHGTWSQLAPMQSGYKPLYFASAVLADGRVVVTGGEYINNSAVWSTQGAVYNPVTNSWVSLTPPSGWARIGDAQCAVLPDGRFILAQIADSRYAILNPTTLAYTLFPGAGKTSKNDEESWTLLPDGNLLTVDAWNGNNCEKLLTNNNIWVNAGSTAQPLSDAGSHEVGPGVLLTDGRVLEIGATGHNAIYTAGPNSADPGTWQMIDDFPKLNNVQLDSADGPAVLMPNGRVLCIVSPGVYNAPSRVFEWDGATSWTPRPLYPRAGSDPSYVSNFLVLPNGQIMLTDFSSDVEIYTPGGSPQDAWRPVITQCPARLFQSQKFTLYGKQLNGLSQCNCYGDDASNASNYPIVRVTNNITGHVRYCRTFNHSTMAVATGNAIVSTTVLVPDNIETGISTLEVVANGIPSAPYRVVVGNKAGPR